MLSVSRQGLEGAFDALDPRLASLGLQNFVTHRCEPLSLNNACLTRFHAEWNAGVEDYHMAQKLLRPAHRLWLLWLAISLTIGPSLMMRGLRIQDGRDQFFLCFVWLLGSIGTLFWLLICLHSTLALRQLVARADKLVCTQPVHKVFLMKVTRELADLRCHFWHLPCTPPVVATAAAALLLSGAPLLYVFGAAAPLPVPPAPRFPWQSWVCR